MAVKLQAQTGFLKGKLTDSKTGEAMPFANVVVKQGDVVIAGGVTDFNGRYIIVAIPYGAYDVEARFIGYLSLKGTGVKIDSSQIVLDLSLEYMGGVVFDCWSSPSYDPPLISKKGRSSTIITGDQIRLNAWKVALSPQRNLTQ